MPRGRFHFSNPERTATRSAGLDESAPFCGPARQRAVCVQFFCVHQLGRSALPRTQRSSGTKTGIVFESDSTLARRWREATRFRIGSVRVAQVSAASAPIRVFAVPEPGVPSGALFGEASRRQAIVRRSAM